LAAEAAILFVIETTALPVIRAKGERSHGLSPTAARMRHLPVSSSADPTLITT
jgi:hypothetical protein